MIHTRCIDVAGRKPWLGVLLLVLSAPAYAQADTLVRKVAETFGEVAWPPEGWNKASGITSLVSDAPSAGKSPKCMEVEVRFSGKGFEWFAASATEPLAIPGDAKKITIQYRIYDKRYPLVIKFKDGWGRIEADKKKLEWGLPTSTEGQWETATFEVPATWVRPVSIVGLSTHNWGMESETKPARFRLGPIEVTTDVSNVDPETGLLKTWKPDPQAKDAKAPAAQPPPTPLLAVAFTTGQIGNVFSREDPAVTVRVRNWKPGTLRGTLTAEVLNQEGKVCDRQQQPVAVEDTAGFKLALKAERFGLYTLNTVLAFADGTQRKSQISFARLAPVKELSAAEKRASPYGINVNGAREGFTIEPFRKAGIVWFREYAFSYEWLMRAKGDDRRYAGWPWYPSLVQRYRDAGAMVLPCLMKSIQPPPAASAAGRVGPDRLWTRQIADVINSFPEMTHWELDNEYDLQKGHADAEAAVQWRNYQAFHRKLAEIVDLLGGGELTTVEQGAAGIFPERVRQSVQSGQFDKVGVVNSHYYCGTETPEENVSNWNTDTGGDFRRQPPASFFDRLREVKRAAASDGRPRESWLTEFGWDTLAGPKVTPYQQAAYLARGWMLAMAAGTDKCFWFYDYDAAEPKVFFDGCGLRTADGGPKLSLCAMAGLASVLPTPKYVGSISAGRGTCGYVFTSDGQRVAALWSIGESQGPSVTFRAKELRDYLGNRLSGLTAKLSLAPVYAVGLADDDTLYRQTAYELSTPYLVGTTAGDPVTSVLTVGNNRAQPLQCKVHVELPQGWKADNVDISADVPASKTKTIPVTIQVPGNEPMGAKEVLLTIGEPETVKQIPVKILVQPASAMEVSPLRGPAGPAQITVRVVNRSSKPMDGTLRMQLPESWKAAVSETPIAGLKPDEPRQVECALTWNTQWKVNEKASIVFDAGGGRTITRNIIPGRIALHRAGKITLDGRTDDWSAQSQVPGWILGLEPGGPEVKVALAWAPDGIYGMVEVPEANIKNPDPRNFWTCNCLELFIDTRDDKRQRGYVAGDHQFWFVPMPAEKRVYAGQWKRAEEIPETRYDLRGVEGVAVAQGRGYVMEFKLPASAMKGFQAAAGRKLGLNLNLSVKREQGEREICWPAAKNTGVPTQPSMWGTMELVDP